MAVRDTALYNHIVNVEQIVRMLILLLNKNLLCEPTVVLDGSYEGYFFSRSKSRWSHFSTLDYRMEDREKMSSFNGYCNCLGITPDQLVHEKVFNIVSGPADFDNIPLFSYPLPIRGSKGAQHFALVPDIDQATWQIWHNVGVGCKGIDCGPWEDPWEVIEALDADTVYSLQCAMILSMIPKWIAANYGEYDHFAEEALKLISLDQNSGEKSPIWWTFKRGDFHKLYARNLRIHVYTICRIMEEQSLSSSNEILIARGLDEVSFDQQFAWLMDTIQDAKSEE